MGYVVWLFVVRGESPFRRSVVQAEALTCTIERERGRGAEKEKETGKGKEKEKEREKKHDSCSRIFLFFPLLFFFFQEILCGQKM